MLTFRLTGGGRQEEGRQKRRREVTAGIRRRKPDGGGEPRFDGAGGCRGLKRWLGLPPCKGGVATGMWGTRARGPHGFQVTTAPPGQELHPSKLDPRGTPSPSGPGKEGWNRMQPGPKHSTVGGCSPYSWLVWVAWGRQAKGRFPKAPGRKPRTGAQALGGGP